MGRNKLSTSMKIMPSSIEDKFRNLSYSPSAHKANKKSSSLEKDAYVSKSNISCTQSNISSNNTINNSPNANSNSNSKKHINTNSSNSNLSKSGNSIFKKLPKLSDTSNRGAEDVIFQIFYTKLNEYKVLQDKSKSKKGSTGSSSGGSNNGNSGSMSGPGSSTSSSTTPKLSSYLLGVFESIAAHSDISFKYRKLIEIMNSINNSENDNNNDSRNLKIELEKEKKESTKKDSQIKSLINEMENFSKEKDNIENVFNILKSKYQTVKQNYSALIQDNQNYKSAMKECKAEIEFLREKEMKMMKVMYLIQKRGISLDDILNDNSMINDSNGNISDSANQSMTTVYFPDKININSQPSKFKVDIPALDFSNIPAYESLSSEENKKKQKQLMEAELIKIENISESSLKNSKKGKVKTNSLNNTQIDKWKSYKSEFKDKYSN